MIRNRNILTMSSFAAMFFLGVGSAIIGAASRNIGLSPFQIGLLLATQNIGFIMSVITVGTMADSIDKASLLAAASLIIAVSFFFFYILLVVSGVTISVIFPLIIALTGLKYPEMSGTVMGIIKLGIPAGGIVVPLMLSLLVQATSFKTSLMVFPIIGITGLILAFLNRKRLTRT